MDIRKWAVHKYVLVPTNLHVSGFTFGPNAMILRTHSTENIMVKAELRKISVLQ